MNTFTINWDPVTGLTPVVIQHAITGHVLMLGYMNQEALDKTIATDRVWFYSRSKQRLWEKGETTGHYLNVQSITTDCDNDTLLIQALPQGPTCHEFTPSCFKNTFASVIQELEYVIDDRKQQANTAASYTAQLFSEGQSKIADKVTEESEEVIRAVREESTERVAEEAADVLYHLLVLLAVRDVNYQDVLTVLHRRRS